MRAFIDKPAAMVGDIGALSVFIDRYFR